MPKDETDIPLLVFNDKGIYCNIADVYLDPWKPVDKAIITHGHADHARWGSRRYIAHHITATILAHRLQGLNVRGVSYGERFTINGVHFSLHPAGHILGSSQVRVEYKGEVWVFTGDYKTEDDGISTPLQPLKCHVLITECTFGLPAFKWLSQREVMQDINDWWSKNAEEGKTSVLFGYALGKAQRLLHLLNPEIGKIYTHGATEQMTSLLRNFAEFPETTWIDPGTKKQDLIGQMVLAPPSAHGSTWIRKMVPYVTAMASGWMAFRGTRRRRAIDRGFVLSDHADWSGLLETIKATGCHRVICTHGYSEIFCRYLNELGLDARTAETQYEGEFAEINAQTDGQGKENEFSA